MMFAKMQKKKKKKKLKQSSLFIYLLNSSNNQSSFISYSVQIIKIRKLIELTQYLRNRRLNFVQSPLDFVSPLWFRIATLILYRHPEFVFLNVIVILCCLPILWRYSDFLISWRFLDVLPWLWSCIIILILYCNFDFVLSF